MEEIEAFVALNHIPYIGAVKVQKLLSAFGSARSILLEPLASIASILGEKDRSLPFFSSWETLSTWKEDLLLVKKEGATLISLHDPSYPPSLKELSDPPFLLYIKGKILEEDKNSIGIIGTRVSTLYGKEMAEKFGKECAGSGFTVVSGLARGIDTHAHVGALQRGRTLAILGSGLSYIYPEENAPLAKKICDSGALISEFPMKTAPDKFHFPKRNRIVSALSFGMLLIEAPLKSGAMITMECSQKLKKLCFAITGRIDISTFTGNHFLIKEQKARLVENPQEMLSLLRPGSRIVYKNEEKQLSSFFNLTSEEENLIPFLKEEEVSIEELALCTKIPIAKLSSLLMGLVLKKKIREFPGKLYRKVI